MLLKTYSFLLLTFDYWYTFGLFVSDPEHEEEDYIQQHSPETNQEQEDAHLVAAGTDDGDDTIQAVDSQ